MAILCGSQRHLLLRLGGLADDVPISVFRQTNGAGLGDTLQSRRDIDAGAHQVAVALLDDIAEMDANAADRAG
jgi:UTP-glucose-1-phosphate uridylyltransferase